MAPTPHSGGSASYAPEINVTPLVDVVLVLLIIFMLIVPALTSGYRVDVPGQAAAAPSTDDRPEQVVLALERTDCPVLEPPGAAGLPAGCTVRLGDESVPIEALAQRIGQTFATRAPAERVLFLTADAGLNYEGVMRVLDVAQSGAAGLRIGFVRDMGSGLEN